MDSPDTREAHEFLPDWREFHRRRLQEDLRFLQYVATTKDELNFFLEVQKLEQNINPYDLESNALYGEGMARIMYDEYADSPWLLSAYRYNDKLGIMKQMEQVLKTNPRHFPVDRPVRGDFLHWMCDQIEKQVAGNKVHVRYVPRATDVVLTDIPGRPNYKTRLKANGHHDVCTARSMLANFAVVADTPQHDTIVLLDQQYKDPDKSQNRLIVLMHELGHEDEILKGSVRLVDSDTGKGSLVQTEFFSTGMALATALMFYKHTRDKTWIQASAFQGALRDWIMRGHPANYFERRKATAVRQSLPNLQIVRNIDATGK